MERYVFPAEGRESLLESYLRPQCRWRTFTFIGLFILTISLIIKDLKVRPMELLNNTFTYLADVLNRMLPPDFSSFMGLISSMIETIEIAVFGTLIAIILSIPMGLFFYTKYCSQFSYIHNLLRDYCILSSNSRIYHGYDPCNCN